MPQRPNGTYVSNADAITAWAPLAREALIATARTYRAVITYQELADRVQQQSQITTDQLMTHWIGRLLERVAVDADRRGDPPLTSLCVHQDGTIGDGYRETPAATAEGDTDAEILAARHRHRCYTEYAHDLPEGGGEPAPPVRVVRRRAPRAASRTAPRAAAVTSQLREVACTSCWMIVPARETCTSCGAALPAS
jgi:hypothetical protein